VVVVVLEFEDGLVFELVVSVLVVSLVSFFSVAGFTTVVLCSVFFSAGGATTVSFCSQAPKRPAQAKMQINFFIGFGWLPYRG
jgi:hypothetical protein